MESVAVSFHSDQHRPVEIKLMQADLHTAHEMSVGVGHLVFVSFLCLL